MLREPAALLQQLAKLFACELRLPEGRAERSRREVAVAVHGDDHKAGAARATQVVMAAADVNDPETGSLERADDRPAAEARK